MSSELLYSILQSNKTCWCLMERFVKKVLTGRDQFFYVLN